MSCLCCNVLFWFIFERVSCHVLLGFLKGCFFSNIWVCLAQFLSSLSWQCVVSFCVDVYFYLLNLLYSWFDFEYFFVLFVLFCFVFVVNWFLTGFGVFFFFLLCFVCNLRMTWIIEMTLCWKRIDCVMLSESEFLFDTKRLATLTFIFCFSDVVQCNTLIN